MTFVVELRDLKKSLPRPLTYWWPHPASALCLVRVRLACLALLAVALGYPVEPGAVPHDGVLAALCGLLTAAVSAMTSLLCDASSSVLALFGDPSSSAFKVPQSLGVCFAEPVLPLDICPAAGPFPTFSGHRVWALAACAVFLFGCGFGRRASAQQGAGR
ncbi:MAG TPA: hypothetical protein VER96_00430 [Polyangiaceae bacterium]|nr:hypothetical protein [Polyangiaceae bacterium]